jgi:hypothetical protein
VVRLVQLAAAWVWCLRWLRRTHLQVRQSCCFCTFLLPAEVNTAVDLLETELLNVYARAAQQRKLR